jgi:ADP-heptose:LPS heptosyltransferase
VPNLGDICRDYGLLTPSKPSNEISALIDKKKFNLILHPKSHGSAREWGLSNYNLLIRLIPKDKYKIFITGTEEESKSMRSFLRNNSTSVKDVTGKFRLEDLIGFINQADGLVAASTGPLHLAAALGKKAIGLYAPMRPIHPGRWAPLGKASKALVIDKSCRSCRRTDYCECIRSIPPGAVITALESDDSSRTIFLKSDMV